MKYEPVFGDQSLFDDAPEDAEMAASVCQMPRWYTMFNGKVLFCDSKKESWQSADFNHPGSQLLAMRRIIAEPKRWTVEDQKAGRLPEVGCLVTTYDHKQYVFVGESCHNDQWSLRDVESGKVYHTPISWVLPIETPEEKAARLREEWCSNALDSASILSGMREYELKRLGGYIEDIYDALLSGDLPVPSAPEQNK